MAKAGSYPTKGHGAMRADTYRGEPEDAKAGYAKRCSCESPQTYRDEDGERRCLCGRAM